MWLWTDRTVPMYSRCISLFWSLNGREEKSARWRLERGTSEAHSVCVLIEN